MVWFCNYCRVIFRNKGTVSVGVIELAWPNEVYLINCKAMKTWPKVVFYQERSLKCKV